MLSSYCQNIKEKFNLNIGQVKKLLPTLSDKQNYVLYYRNRQLYTSLGLHVKKIHRALEFKQFKWLKKIYRFYYTKEG